MPLKLLTGNIPPVTENRIFTRGVTGLCYRRSGRAALLAASTAMVAGLVTAAPAGAAPDSFFTYSGSDLASLKPGQVVKSRELTMHVQGNAMPISAVQLTYRTVDAQNRPVVNVTSVLKPPGGVDPSRAIAYQSFYDSLNPEDSPSRAIAGTVTEGGQVNSAEAGLIAPMLTAGYTVIVADIEGQKANFAAGPPNGANPLDSIRAATRSPLTGLKPSTKIGLFGYSGGAIGTNWAAALAPNYAPDVNRRLVGAASGGLLVNPIRNLTYISGSKTWSGVAAMAIIGIARSYDVNFSKYLSEYGKKIVAEMQTAPINNVMGHYPGMTWKQLMKPQYADPMTVTPFVETVGKINLGKAPTPTVPLFIGQAAAGELEGTVGNKPRIGKGDGVMIAGDVRALARQYCARGNRAISYQQYDQLSHTPGAAAFLPGAFSWLNDRFIGKPAPNGCGAIAPGNTLDTTP